MYKEFNLQLRSNDFDSNNMIKPDAILDLFQTMAGSHAEEIGVGFKEMEDKNLFWVISKSRFDIIEKPVFCSICAGSTWPNPNGRVEFSREYKIKSNDGTLLIKGTSYWVVIDSTTRKLQRPDKVSYNGEFHIEKNYDEEMGKLIFDFTPNNSYSTYTVSRSDIDHNLHMNNSKYGKIVLNMLSESEEMKSFEISFLSESLLGDEIKTYRVDKKDGIYFYGYNKDSRCFMAKVIIKGND